LLYRMSRLSHFWPTAIIWRFPQKLRSPNQIRREKFASIQSLQSLQIRIYRQIRVMWDEMDMDVVLKLMLKVYVMMMMYYVSNLQITKDSVDDACSRSDPRSFTCRIRRNHNQTSSLDVWNIIYCRILWVWGVWWSDMVCRDSHELGITPRVSWGLPESWIPYPTTTLELSDLIVDVVFAERIDSEWSLSKFYS
jgi:hypothetical protein